MTGKGKRSRRAIAAMVSAMLAGIGGPAAFATPTNVQLWRLECGAFQIKDGAPVRSDTFAAKPGPLSLTNSCYLVRHGSQYLLWDTGFTERLAGAEYEMPMQVVSMGKSIPDQLAQLGLKPGQVTYVGISHYHGDHTGQAHLFPAAKLLIGTGDWRALKSGDQPDTAADLDHWLTKGGAVQLVKVDEDFDVFGDGSVTVLRMPGHTPGHQSLLVRLAGGPVLLSGDSYITGEQLKSGWLPSNTADRANALASRQRFNEIAKELGAKIIVQHDPADISKLPAFPAAAD